jgi:hypothetical protein
MTGSQYYQGNYGAWSVHMDGVRRIVELRGGMGMLSQLIREKIYRSVMLFSTQLWLLLMDLDNYSTDLLGCIEIGAAPRFPAVDLPKPLFPPSWCNLPPAVSSLAETYTLEPDFLALLSAVTTYTTSTTATQDAPSLQYRLVSLCSMRQYQRPIPSAIILAGPFHSQVRQAQSQIVQELLLIGALLFLSLPHMRTLLPLRPVDYGYLISRLNSFASPLCAHDTLLQHADFLLWLFFLGEVFSSTSMSFSACARVRSPFRMQLRAVSAILDIASWEEMSIALGKMWFIEPRHAELYQCLCEDVFNYN